MLFSAMLTDAFRNENVGIEFRSITDGGFYKPQRLRTQSKVMLDILRDLLFADDCALCASTEGKMQRMVDLFAKACANFGLTISIKKTGVMFQPAPCQTLPPLMMRSAFVLPEQVHHLVG